MNGKIKTACLAAGIFPLWLVAEALALYAPPLMVEDFEGDEIRNSIGNRANVFVRAPSKAMITRRMETVSGKRSSVLMLQYKKENRGGPYDSGGWCGYYTLLKSPAPLVAPGSGVDMPAEADIYFDATDFKAVTFYVRGETGAENFVVGLADRHWDKVGDSVKSQPIGNYLPAGKLTKDWQRAEIPLSEFFLDQSQLAAIAFVFEGDLFSDAGHAGSVYIDDIAFE